MRFVIIITTLIGCTLQLSAKAYSQLVTLNVRNEPLLLVLREIYKQTGFGFSFNDEVRANIWKVTINVKNAPLPATLDKLFTNLPLVYRIIENRIIINLKKEADLKETSEEKPAVRKDIEGKVLDDKGEAIAGATVTVKGTNIITSTKSDGTFRLSGINENATLIVSSVGYEPKIVKVTNDQPVTIKLTVTAQEMKLVTVSTGYQQIPKERATGSFVSIGDDLLNRRVSTNILDRLDGIASGVLFNRNKIANTPDISIRGRSTIFADPNPLIILDNFPYDGDIGNINPQDVQSVTILKDAAAASIWGVRAGNGVIVITTNKGKLNQKPTISFNANVTIGDKPDLYYLEQLTPKQYIEVEQSLFDNGKYDYSIGNKYDIISPAVEIMQFHKNGTISLEEKDRMLDSLSLHDNRSDINRYYNRHSINQQYQLNISGGGANNRYYFSAGYDRILPSSTIQNSNRVTLNATNSYYLFKNKMELITGILFSNKNDNTTAYDYVPSFPYERIADEMGHPLNIADGTLRLGYVDTAGGGRLLDWHYRPLDELNGHLNTSEKKLTDYRVNVGLNYTMFPGLKLSLNYTYQKGLDESVSNADKNSYYTRNLVNQYSQIDAATGTVYRPLPYGDIHTNITNTYYAHYGRGQLSYENTFSQRHALNIIAGYEIKDYQNRLASIILYGYDKETEANGNSSINFTQDYNFYYGFNVSKIPTGINNSRMVDRFLSYFTNASYTYDSKYTFSLSARKDKSNLFGVNSNQKGVPLWSAGLSWDISKEYFYNLDALPYLKLRVTFGYNGNLDKTTSAYLTARAFAGNINLWNFPYLNIQNPPNPSLRWEKVKNVNFGFDFESRNNRISGSAEYWIKEGIDLIGNSPIAPQTGITSFRGNSANMRSRGIDLTLNTRNIVSTEFKWLTTVLFNFATDKITKYKVKQGTNNDIVSSNYINPLEGYSYYSIFSYKWQGLDTAGNPLSLLDGKVSDDYSSVYNSLEPDNLVYHGSVSPKIFGSIRNTFSWKGLDLSCNILYKFNYYFRRNSLNNSELYAGIGASSYRLPDYNLRWQKKGDELTTNVPSLIYPANFLRDLVYKYSEVLVEKGDHIRLKDIRLNYNLNKKQLGRLPLTNLSFYIFLDNVGIIWKATDKKIDPDYVNSIPIPRTYTIGLTAGFKN